MFIGGGRNAYRVLVLVLDSTTAHKEEAGKSFEVRSQRRNGSPGFDKEARLGAGAWNTVRAELLLLRLAGFGVGCVCEGARSCH